MGRPSIYKTKQSEAILMYIASLGDSYTTAAKIVAHFESLGSSIALTTIYRHLDRFVDRGRVRRFAVDGVPGACFQYIGRESYCKEEFHLQCECCGELIPLQCTVADEFQVHVSEAHNFEIDSKKTVLHGKCRNCMEKNQ